MRSREQRSQLVQEFGSADFRGARAPSHRLRSALVGRGGSGSNASGAADRGSPSAARPARARWRGGDFDLLAQDAKAAIAQKFALAAEQRRGGERDQPAAIKPGTRPPDGDAEKVCRSPNTRTSSPPRSNPTRRRRASTDSAGLRRVRADRGDKHGIGRAEAALPVKRPQEARMGRRRVSACGAGFPAKSGAAYLWAPELRAVAGVGGSSARRAQRPESTAKASSRPPAPAIRAQRKLTLIARRRSTTRRIRSRRGGPPTGSVAARWRRRRADRPLAPHQPGFERLASSAPKKASTAGLALTTSRPAGTGSRAVLCPSASLRRAAAVEGRGGLFAQLGREVGRTMAASGSKSALAGWTYGSAQSALWATIRAL